MRVKLWCNKARTISLQISNATLNSEYNLSTIGMVVINSLRRGYPPDLGAHIALRMRCIALYCIALCCVVLQHLWFNIILSSSNQILHSHTFVSSTVPRHYPPIPWEELWQNRSSCAVRDWRLEVVSIFFRMCTKWFIIISKLRKSILDRIVNRNVMLITMHVGFYPWLTISHSRGHSDVQ